MHSKLKIIRVYVEVIYVYNKTTLASINYMHYKLFKLVTKLSMPCEVLKINKINEQ